MKLKSLLLKTKKLLLLFKKKGVKYVFNKSHFYFFYGTKNPFLDKIFNLIKPYPSYIEIETTTNCNLKCKMCEHTYWNEPVQNMTFEQFKNIADQFPRLKWIGLTGIGEGFLNKDFLKMLEYVKSKNIFVELYDNFFLIDEKVAEKLIDLEIDKIFVSLDAATKETYEKIRVGSDFEVVVNNIKNFIKLKKDRGSFFPEFYFHFVISKENFQEIPKYIELVYSIVGKNTNIQFSRVLHKFKEINNLFVEVSEEIKRSAENEAKKMGIKLSWNADILQNKPPIEKCARWLMPFIFVTGEVIPCCSKNEANQRFLQKETSLGNVFERPFKEIWAGEKYENFRKTLQSGGVPNQCENCCLYDLNKKNESFIKKI